MARKRTPICRSLALSIYDDLYLYINHHVFQSAGGCCRVSPPKWAKVEAEIGLTPCVLEDKVSVCIKQIKRYIIHHMNQIYDTMCLDPDMSPAKFLTRSTRNLGLFDSRRFPPNFPGQVWEPVKSSNVWIQPTEWESSTFSEEKKHLKCSMPPFGREFLNPKPPKFVGFQSTIMRDFGGSPSLHLALCLYEAPWQGTALSGLRL